MSEEKTKEKPKMSLNELRRLKVISEGKDPDQQQIVNDFMKMDNVIERTNLPTTNGVLCMAQLEVASNWLYSNHPNNPFALMRNALAIAYMARKGEKSQQFVDIVRTAPDLSGLQSTLEQSQQGGILDRFRRGTTE